MLLLLLACPPDKPYQAPPNPTGDGLMLQGCPIGGQAHARILQDIAERPWGEEALAAPGDVLLLSTKAAFVIQGPDDPRTYYHYGGSPIDAVAVVGCDQAGPEIFEEAGFVVGRLNITDFNSSTLHQVRGESIEIVSDGSDGGPAIVDVHATDDRFWLVEMTLARNVYNEGDYKELGDLFGLDITLRYTLDPDSAVLQTTVFLDGQPAEDGFLVGALVFPSDLTPVRAFSTGSVGAGGFNVASGVPWLSMGSAGGSHAIAMPGAGMGYTDVSGVTALIDINQALSPLIVNGAATPPETDFLFSVSATDPASAGAALAPYLPTPITGQQSGWEYLAGSVLDTTGQPVVGAEVQVYAEAQSNDWRLIDRLFTDSYGNFEGRTLYINGIWQLMATGLGRDDGTRIPTTAGQRTQLPIGAPGGLYVDAKDENGQGLPVRVELERSDGQQTLLFALPAEHLALAPGQWEVWVSRGYEYDIAHTTVTVPENGEGTLSVTLNHLVDTTGWASTDTHVHAAPSADSSTLGSDRMRTVAASGLDSFVSTDHEAIIDLSLAQSELGLSNSFVYGLGSEVTATVPEHINAWPFPVVGDPRGDAVRWYQMGFSDIYDAIRSRGATVIQLNHSRVNGECGILCVADWDRLSDPPYIDTPEALGMLPGTTLWSWDFDSFEVMNGLRSPYIDLNDPRHTGALMDWLAFHNLGHPVTGMAVTDVHTVEVPGSPRTYVRVANDQAAAFSIQDLADGVLAGAAQISAGAFADVSIDGAGPGELATAANGQADLNLRVQALPEVDVQESLVLVNCDLVERIPSTAPNERIKLDTTIPLSLSEDAYIVVLGIGQDAMPRGLENYDARTVPRLITSPIFVDVDQDGQWTAPGPKSCDFSAP